MDESKFKTLEAALEDAALASLVSPVIAAGFGVAPLKKEGDVVVLGVTSQHNPDCTKILEKALNSRVVCIPFDDEAVEKCIQEVYLKESSVNLNTFEEEDFLSKEENLGKLTSEKNDYQESRQSLLPPDEVIFLDVSYRSFLENIDFPATCGPFICGSLDIPYKIDGNTAVVYSEEKVASDVFMLMRKNCFFDGDGFRHGILAKGISHLPYLVHPSEIQITQVGADGAVSFYLYDHVERVAPGETKQWQFQYYFLNSGSRYRRELTLKVNDMRKLNRSEIVYSDKPTSWGTEDLERWFEFDFC